MGGDLRAMPSPLYPQQGRGLLRGRGGLKFPSPGEKGERGSVREGTAMLEGEGASWSGQVRRGASSCKRDGQMAQEGQEREEGG